MNTQNGSHDLLGKVEVSPGFQNLIGDLVCAGEYGNNRCVRIVPFSNLSRQRLLEPVQLVDLLHFLEERGEEVTERPITFLLLGVRRVLCAVSVAWGRNLYGQERIMLQAVPYYFASSTPLSPTARVAVV